MNDQVQAYFTRLQDDPGNPEAFAGLEAYFRKEKMWKDLIGLYEGQTLRELSPADLSQIFLKIAKIYEVDLQSPSEAMAVYKRGQSACPKEVGLFQEMFGFLMRQRLFEEALLVSAQLEVLVRQKPILLYQVYRQNFFLFLDGLQKPQEALAWIEKMLEIRPTEGEPLILVERLPNPEVGWLRLLSSLNRWFVLNKNPELQNRFKYLNGYVLGVGLKRYKDAVNVLKPLVAGTHKWKGESARILGRVFFGLEDPSAGIHYLKMATDLAESPEERLLALVDLGRAYQSQKEFTKSKLVWLRVLEINPLDDLAFTFLRDACLEKRDYESWAKAIERRLEEDQPKAQRYALLLEIAKLYHVQLARPEKSIGFFLEVLKVSPLELAAFIPCLEIAIEKPMPELLQQLLALVQKEQTRGNGMAAVILKVKDAISLKAANQTDKAIRIIQDLYRDLSENEEFFALLCRWYEAKKSWKELSEVVGVHEDRTAETPRKIELLIRRAQIFSDYLSDESGACVMLKKILILDPLHAKANFQLESIYRKRENWGDLLHLYTFQLDHADSVERQLKLFKEVGKIWLDRLGDAERSYPYFESAFKIDPEQVEILTYLNRVIGLTHFNQFRLDVIDKLLLHFERAKDIPSMIKLYDDALVFLSQDLNLETLAEAEKSRYLFYLNGLLTIAPDRYDAVQKLHSVLFMDGKYLELVEILRKTLQHVQTPEIKTSIFIQIANCLESKVRSTPEDHRNVYYMDEIVEAWNQARKLDPKNRKPLEALYGIYCEQKKWPLFFEIGQDIDRLMGEAEGGGEQWIVFATHFSKHLIEQSDFDDFLLKFLEKIYRKQIENQQDVDWILHALSLLTERMAEWNHHISVLERRLQRPLTPEAEIEIRLKLAQTFEEYLNDPERALNECQASLLLAPFHKNAVEALRRILEREKKWQDLLVFLEGQLANPEISEKEREDQVLYLAFIAATEKKEYPQAIMYLETILDVQPDNLVILEKIMHYAEKGDLWQIQHQTIRKMIEVAQRQKNKISEIKYFEYLLALSLRHPVEETRALANTLLKMEPDHTMAIDVLEETARQEQDWIFLDDMLNRRLRLPQTDIKRTLLSLAKNAEVNLKDIAKARNYFEEIFKRKIPLDFMDLPWMEELLLSYRAEENWRGWARLGEAKVDALESPEVSENDRKEKLTVEFLVELGGIFHTSINDSIKAAIYLQKAATIMFKTLQPAWSPRFEETLFFPLEKILDQQSSLSSQVELVSVLKNKFVLWVAAAANDTVDQSQLAQLAFDIGRRLIAQLKDSAGGVEFLRKSLDIQPLNLEVFQFLCRHLEDIGAFEQLIKVYEQRAERITDLKEVCGLLLKSGNIWEKQLREKLEAKLCYQRIVEIAPIDFKEVDFCVLLEKLYREDKNDAALSQVLEFVFNRTDNLDRKADVLFQMGRLNEEQLNLPAKAYDYYRQAVDLFDDLNAHPVIKPALVALSRLSVEGEKWPDASRFLESLVLVTLGPTPETLIPSDVDLEVQKEMVKTLNLLADLRIEILQDFDGAVWALSILNVLVPKNVDAYRKLRKIYTAQEKWHKVAEVFERIMGFVSIKQEKVALLNHYGDLLLTKLDDAPRARAVFEQILALDPSQESAFSLVVEILAEKSEWPAIVNLCNDLLQQSLTRTAREKVLRQITKVTVDVFKEKENAIAFWLELAREFKDLDALNELEELADKKDDPQLSEVLHQIRSQFDLSPDEAFRAKVLFAKFQMKKGGDEAQEGQQTLEGLLNKVDDLDFDQPYVVDAFVDLFHRWERQGEWQKIALQKDRGFKKISESKLHNDGLRIDLKLLLARSLESLGETPVAALNEYVELVSQSLSSGLSEVFVSENLNTALRLAAEINAFDVLNDLLEMRIQFDLKHNLEANPDRLAFARIVLEHFRHDQNKIDRALGMVEDVISEQPLDVSARALLNRLLAEKGLHKRLVDSLGAEIAVVKNEERKNFLREQLAFVQYFETKQQESAKQLLIEVVKSDPKRKISRSLLVSIFLSEHAYGLALETLLGGIDHEEDNYALQCIFMEAARMTREHLQDATQEAQFIERAVMLQNPKMPHRDTLRALAKRLDAGQTPTAASLEALYQYVMNFGDDSEEALMWQVAESLLKQNPQDHRAIKIVESFVSRNPNHVAAQERFGLMLLKQGDAEKAYEILRSCLNHSGGDAVEISNEALAFLSEESRSQRQSDDSTFANVNLYRLKKGLIREEDVFQWVEHSAKDTLMLQQALRAFWDFREQLTTLPSNTRSLLWFAFAQSTRDDAAFAACREHSGSARWIKLNAIKCEADGQIERGNPSAGIAAYEQLISVMINPHEEETAEFSNEGKYFDALTQCLPSELRPNPFALETVLFRLAKAFEGENPSRAIELYHQGLELSPHEFNVWENLIQLVMKHAAPETRPDILWTAYGRMGEVNEQTPAIRQARHAWLEQLAELPDLGEAKTEEDILSEVLRVFPKRNDVRIRLAQGLGHEGKTSESVREHGLVLAADPLHQPSYEALFHFALAQNQTESACIYAEVMEALGWATEESAALLRHVIPEGRFKAGILKKDLRKRVVLSTATKDYVLELLRLLKGGLEKAFRFSPEALGLTKKDRLKKSSDVHGEFFSRMQAIAKCIGEGECEVYRHAAREEAALTLEVGSSPVLVVTDRYLKEVSQKEWLFDLGFYYHFIADDVVFLTKIKPQKLEKMLRALPAVLRAQKTSEEIEAEDLENTQKTSKQLSRKVKKNIEPLLNQFLSSATSHDDFNVAIDHVVQNALRLAVLFSGSFYLGAQFLFRQNPNPEKKLAAFVKKEILPNGQLHALWQFYLSPEFLELRRLIQ